MAMLPYTSYLSRRIIYNYLINAYSEGKISNEQYANLKTDISILYEEIYNKRIDSSNGNATLLDSVKNDIKCAYVKGKLSEQHYKLLIGKVSDSKNNQGSIRNTRYRYGVSG